MRVLVFILLLLPSLATAQGSVEELEKRNGFKDIKLLTSAKSYDGLEVKSEEVEHETFPNTTVYTAKKGAYETIGNLKIYELEVSAYKDSIYQIVVITEKEQNLYKGMKKLFGDPEYAYGSGNYYWSNDVLRLDYGSHSKNKIALKYFSYLMVEKRKQEKKQVIEDIADDF